MRMERNTETTCATQHNKFQILQTIRQIDKTEDVYNKLLQIDHPVEDLNELYNRLKRTSQTDFKFIKDYTDKIIQIDKEIRFTSGLSDAVVDQSVNEYFYTNLHHLTKIEMKRRGITEKQDIYNQIRSVERIIIEQLVDWKINSSKNRKDKNNFCDYHQTTSHSNDDCRAQRKERKIHSGALLVRGVRDYKL